MSLVSWIEIALIGLGILGMVGGNRLSSPLLSNGGLALVGIGLIVIGGDAMVTRRYVVRRRGSTDWTYYGLGAVLIGIVFVWVGVVAIAIALVLLSGTEQAFIHHTIRRPGSALLNLSFVVLAASGIVFSGSRYAGSGTGSGPLLKALLVIVHSLPGAILLLLALALLALGVLEMVSPATFDQLGGGFLEVLFLGGSS